jgi:hypothetical protein
VRDAFVKKVEGEVRRGGGGALEGGGIMHGVREGNKNREQGNLAVFAFASSSHGCGQSRASQDS